MGLYISYSGFFLETREHRDNWFSNTRLQVAFDYNQYYKKLYQSNSVHHSSQWRTFNTHEVKQFLDKFLKQRKSRRLLQ